MKIGPQWGLNPRPPRSTGTLPTELRGQHGLVAGRGNLGSEFAVTLAPVIAK